LRADDKINMLVDAISYRNAWQW